MLEQAITFGPFCLDPRAGLTRGRRSVRLTPRALAVLRLLAGERGRVVPKEEIFRVVWRGSAVGDAALVTCIQELRRALHDKAGKPRYIETLHRRGYRFISPPAVPQGQPAELPGFTGPDAGMLVGRHRQLAELDEALASARAGNREVAFVTGEAGIGKTSLVRAFVARAAHGPPVQLAWGQSAEHYGSSEPYHTVLDALARACRAPAGAALLKALGRHAPLWLAQLPSLLSPARLRSVQRRCAGAPPERMQRELTDALEAAAHERPLVLWLEDLHWADAPTIDWLATFARRPERVPILVLATFRAQEARAERHPLHALRDELARHGRARTLALEPLDREAVEAYVLARFAPHASSAPALARLAHHVYERTDGSPLFMVGVLTELASAGLLYRDGGAWSVAQAAGDAELGIPAYLRELIDRQFDRLGADDLSLLEAGCVAGLHFASALVAAVANRPLQEVDRACARLAREHGVIVPAGVEAWPDGTVTSRYSFAHALYREALASRLPAGLAAQLHGGLGERLALAYRTRADEVAGQLAMHFERGRNPGAAVEWLLKAGDAASRRKAAREAVAHYRHGLNLLGGLAPARRRDELNAALHLALCAPLIGLEGMGSPGVEQCAAEALEACAKLGDARGRFAAHRVLWNNSLMRYPVTPTLRHAKALMAQARASGDAVELALAHRALGCSYIYVGQFERAAALLERGAALADASADAGFLSYDEHPGMVCRSFCAWPKAFMGLRDQAVRLSDEAIEHARRRDEPNGLAFALVTAGLVDLFHRDAGRAAAVAREVGVLAGQYRLAQWIAFAHEIEGWVAFASGDHARGIALMSEALERLHATGARTHSSRILANLAECFLAAGRLGEARHHIDAALAHRARHGEEYYAAELLRLQALILQRQGASAKDVKATLEQALRIARKQRARLFEMSSRKARACLLGKEQPGPPGRNQGGVC